ncbi:MAG TPA: hypothetical protein VKX96_13555 [Chloroflexota bacterium]|nr:hypothetical protein [Chloroflexota bacterium]
MPKKRLGKSSLLWFIRSRSYVSIPDIRRRFNLTCAEDEVSAITTPRNGTVYVGLPREAARLLQDLVREDKVGIELEAGIMANAVVGVYVMPHRGDSAALPSSGEEEEATGAETALAT